LQIDDDGNKMIDLSKSEICEEDDLKSIKNKIDLLKLDVLNNEEHLKKIDNQVNKYKKFEDELE
jgi:hypothetical protein